LRVLGLILLVLFLFWFDRHNLHFADVLFSQLNPKQILLFISQLVQDLARAIN